MVGPISIIRRFGGVNHSVSDYLVTRMLHQEFPWSSHESPVISSMPAEVSVFDTSLTFVSMVETRPSPQLLVHSCFKYSKVFLAAVVQWYLL